MITAALSNALTMSRRRILSWSTCLAFWLSRLLTGHGFLEHCWIAPRRASTVRVAAGPDIPGQRTQRVRRKSRNRHPPSYWQEFKNVETAFRDFWANLGVNIPINEPPPIPNETLLNHFERNDLRYVVVSYGGRKSLSDRLGGARVIPGRWNAAVEQSPELQALVRNATHGLSPNLPPLSPQQKKQENIGPIELRNQTRWNHSPGRKPKGYWTMELVVQEL